MVIAIGLVCLSGAYDHFISRINVNRSFLQIRLGGYQGISQLEERSIDRPELIHKETQATIFASRGSCEPQYLVTGVHQLVCDGLVRKVVNVNVVTIIGTNFQDPTQALGF